MQIGDPVLTDHPERRSRQFIRSFGIVRRIARNKDIIVELADGSVMRRSPNSVAVFVHPPANWKELFARQHIVFSQPRQQIMSGRSQNKKHNR